jgi:hypothetical protein
MTHLALPSRLRIRARSLVQVDDFSMKRVIFWALVFVEAFFVGALLGRILSMM